MTTDYCHEGPLAERRLNWMRRAASIALSSIIGLLLIYPAEVANASPTPFHSVELNVNGHYVGALTYAAANLHPLNLMAEEVCSPAFSTLHDSLVAQGYTVRSYPAIESTAGLPHAACPVAGQTMYNVVASGGVTVRGDAWPVRYADQAPKDIANPDESQRDYRGFVCMRSSFIFRVWISCSSHMTNVIQNGIVYAERQGHFLMSFANGFFPSTPHLLGMDFNRKPCEGPGNYGPFDYYWPYREADAIHTQQTCDTGGYYTFKPKQTKIDYIWALRSMTLDYFGAADIGCAQSITGSDHCYYHAAFQWP